MTAVIPNSSNVYAQGSSNYSEKVEIPVISNRSPNSQDIRHVVGKRWINTLTNQVYTLLSFSFNGLAKNANWTSLTSTAFPVAARGTSPALSGINTVVNATGTLSSSFIYLAANTLAGNIGPVGITSSATNSFTISSGNSANTSTYNYLVVN